MIDLVNLSLWAVLAVFLAYIPFLWYWDIRYREVEPIYWWPLLIVCVPITASLYMIEMYPWYSLVISLVMCGIFYAAFRYKYLEGADFLYLIFISLFWVVNPHPWPHGLMQVMFYIYLLVAMFGTALCVLVYNFWKGNRYDLVAMMSKYPGNVPFMIPISCAFVLTVVMG